MAKRHIIISTDTGNNGMKTILGEMKKDGAEQILVLHDSSDIIRATGIKVANVKEKKALYITKKEANGEIVRYIAGTPAKNIYMNEDGAKDRLDTKFYSNSESEAADYLRFETDSFAMLHLAVIYEALEKFGGISEENDKINSDDNSNFDLTIAVALPEAIAQQGNYQTIITSYIKDSEKNGSFKFSLDGFDDVENLQKILSRADIKFYSQVYCAAVCEISSLNVSVDEMKKYLPMFVWDCGGKTTGIARIEKSVAIGEKKESNRDYSITRICMAVAEQIKKNYDYDINPEQIEAKAMSEDEYMIYDVNNSGKSVSINIKDIYNEKLEENIKGLFDYSWNNYTSQMASARTYLIAGGAGQLYYNTLEGLIKNKIEKEFKDDAANRRYILAQGKYGDVENGCIYSIATGAFILAANSIDAQ